VPQWDEKCYYDQFFRDERYEFGGAREGDWNWDPDLDGTLEYDPNDPWHHFKYTMSGQRWLASIRDGDMRFDVPAFEFCFGQFREIFNTKFCGENLFVVQDQYLPFLQRQAAIMNNGTWAVPTLLQDMEQMDEARREQLALGTEAKIEPFEWGTFDNPPMVHELVDGPIRAVESAGGPYLSVIEKEQAQTELSLDFMMFWLCPVGMQTWADSLIADGNYRPGGPHATRNIKLPEPFKSMYADVQMIGNAEIPWNSTVKVGPGGSKVRDDFLENFTQLLQFEISPEEYAKNYQQIYTDGLDEILEGANLTHADLDHPERQPTGR
jgi:hypothetical protein